VPQQEERDGERGLGRPEDARDLVEEELAVERAVVEAACGEEVHGRAFRECAEAALPDDLSSDRVSREEHPRRLVHG